MALLLEEALAAEHFPCLAQWPVKTIAKKPPTPQKKKPSKKSGFLPQGLAEGMEEKNPGSKVDPIPVLPWR